MFIESYLQTAKHLFEQYELQMPLHLYLKEYFRNNRKFGSRDRKIISELMYGIYRLGKVNDMLPLRTRFLLGSFLSGRLPKLFFDKTDKNLAEQYESSFAEKKLFAQTAYECSFELAFELSHELNEAQFFELLYQQAHVFIRVRQHADKIVNTLHEKSIPFKKINDTSISLDANIKLDELLNPEDYVIQDYSSQQVGNLFAPKTGERWWDCCCASGGKAIQLLDKNNKIDLIVTDVRESIIKNLHERMKLYSYESNYISHVLDASKDITAKIKNTMDAIICDVPCSGSGTWSRSPEQYYFFTEDKLNQFSELQFSIVSNVMNQLKENASLYYITCSVFKRENEMVIERLLQHSELHQHSSQLINGTQHGADTMYESTLRIGEKDI